MTEITCLCFGLHHCVLWLVKKNGRLFLIQSEVKPKPTVTRSHAFFSDLRKPYVIAESFFTGGGGGGLNEKTNWLIELSSLNINFTIDKISFM